MSEWRKWDEVIPGVGGKVAIVCSDGCSSSVAIVLDEGVLEAEDAWPLSNDFLKGSLWMYLPEDYPIRFMEVHDDY